MTATAPAPGMRAERGNPGVPGAAGQQLAPPPKMRRRPAMIALSIACIAVGGMASAWAWQATSDTNTVLTVSDTVLRGEVITREDLVRVQVGTDLAITAVPADQIEAVVGRTAVLDIAEGSVLTADQFADEVFPTAGNSIVGVSLTAGLLPAGQVGVGDKVRVVTTGDNVDGSDEGTEEAVDGIIRNISADDVTGNTLANVEISGDDAVRVASAAATGNVALILEHQDPTREGTASATVEEPASEPSTDTEVEGDAVGAPARPGADADEKGL